LDICVGSLKDKIAKNLDCDVFAHVADDGDAHKIGLLDLTDWRIEPDPVLDERDYARRLGPGQPQGVQGILRQLYSVQQCNALKSRHERDNGFRYDWVLRVRADSLFLTAIENLETLDPNHIYIPTHDNWAVDGTHGLNDRFAFGSSALMDVYSNRLDALHEYFGCGGLLHPETFLGAYLARRGVPLGRTQVMLATVRKNGRRLQPALYRQFGDIL
jgi:hypothetical protein